MSCPLWHLGLSWMAASTLVGRRGKTGRELRPGAHSVWANRESGSRPCFRAASSLLLCPRVRGGHRSGAATPPAWRPVRARSLPPWGTALSRSLSPGCARTCCRVDGVMLQSLGGECSQHLPLISAVLWQASTPCAPSSPRVSSLPAGAEARQELRFDQAVVFIEDAIQVGGTCPGSCGDWVMAALPAPHSSPPRGQGLGWLLDHVVLVATLTSGLSSPGVLAED